MIILSKRLQNIFFKKILSPNNIRNKVSTLRKINVRNASSTVPQSLKVTMPIDDIESRNVLNYLNNTAYPEIIAHIKKIPDYKRIPEIFNRLQEVIDYSAPFGKRLRSVRLMKDFQLLADPEDINMENTKLAAIVAWSLEFLITAILILDDIMDNSEIRRGKTSWFKLPGIGLNAVTDAGILEMFTFNLVKKYFENQPNYLTVLHLLQECMFFTQLGQGLDYCSIDPVSKKVQFEFFNIEWYNKLCEYKTAHITILKPFEMSLALANKYDKIKVDEIKHIMVQLGIFFQIQNDYKDLFRNQGEILENNEKISLEGTDIPTGQVTWFAVQALAKGNVQQKKIIQENYGKADLKCIETVLNVYDELNLLKQFLDYEEFSFQYLCDEIEKINNGFPKEVFKNYVEAVYKRRP